MYKILEKKSLPKSQFLLSIEIPAEEVKHEEAHVLAELKKDTELPGFRKGFVPDDIIRKRTGESALYEEAAAHALSHALAEIFQTEKLDVIGRPRVETQKMAPGNPAIFKVTLSLYPKLSLPDYKAIAGKENARVPEKNDVEEKDIDAVIAEIKKQHEAAGMRDEHGSDEKKEFLLSDETVKELGDFKDLADFRAKVKEGLTARKEERNREKRRAELLEKLAEKTSGDIPDILIEAELERMENELGAELKRMGSSFENYLKETKKDRETLRREWQKDAERRARLQLMLLAIAREEKITASKEEIEAEALHLLSHHKNADPSGVRSYVETLLTNQKVLEFLENQK